MTKIILTEEDMIKTYPERNQNISFTYLNYLKTKQENPTFGYKKLSKLLNKPIHTTRYWHHSNAIPEPIRTVSWLNERELIPLDSENQRLSTIAKISGTTFGDGGVFKNLNAIFLSSSELEAVKEFGEDLKILFGNGIERNSRIIEGGEYGHSWCYQNTNRNIIRFFMALGAPIGDKSLIGLNIPNWIIKSGEEIKDEFFGSLFGGEIGIPKIHKEGNRLDTLSIGITGKDEFKENRTKFLEGIAKYLNDKSIITGKISINDHKKCNRKGEPTKIYRLLISTSFENVTNFATLIKINYCRYKKEKLANTMNEFSEIKRQRFKDLLEMGYAEEAISKLLKLTPASLYIIENYEDFNNIYNN